MLLTHRSPNDLLQIQFGFLSIGNPAVIFPSADPYGAFEQGAPRAVAPVVRLCVA